MMANIQELLIDMLYTLPVILIALSFHEWAHAYAAYRCGDPTARNLGRMTINPIRHIDIPGFIMLLLFHIGWAKPVPVNGRNLNHPKRDFLIVTLAGVTVNFLLAFLFYGLWFFLFGVRNTDNVPLETLLYYAWLINLNLFIFNLLPIYPLDGYQVFRSFTGPRLWASQAGSFFERYGYVILIILLVTGTLTVILTSVAGFIASGFSQFYSLFV